MNRKLFTLVFVKKDSKLLLGYKKRGFGEGKWNGFGGKVESGESLQEGAKRELNEESHLIANHLNHIGIAVYKVDTESPPHEVHIFTTDQFSGTPKETEEMRPQWYDLDKIPFSDMWPDFKKWYPNMLKNEHFSVFVAYDKAHQVKSIDVWCHNSLVEALESIKNKDF